MHKTNVDFRIIFQMCFCGFWIIAVPYKSSVRSMTHLEVVICLHNAHISEDSYQTVQMHRLIRVLTRCTCKQEEMQRSCFVISEFLLRPKTIIPVFPITYAEKK